LRQLLPTCRTGLQRVRVRVRVRVRERGRVLMRGGNSRQPIARYGGSRVTSFMTSLFRYLGFPYPPYALRIMGRTVLMWLLLKLFFLALFPIFRVMGPLSAILLPSFGVPALLVFIDRVRAQERLLQANLGASGWWLGVPSLGICLALDALVRMLASAGGPG
jgi:hypothetical protein